MLRQIILLALCFCVSGQKTFLVADGNSDGTYALLNRVLGGTAYEVPDCTHPISHITQIMDPGLGTPVFRFASHVESDNDRCQVFDRMRTEIKTYGSSPANLKGFLGESVSLSWDLKLSALFQPTLVIAFTHIFQIKAVDGDDTMPLITISPQLLPNGQKVLLVTHRQAGPLVEVVLWQDALEPYLGRWLHITTEYTCEPLGKFHIRITRKDNDQELMSYTNDSLKMWNEGNTFLRPKWGIYRSFIDKPNMRDEFVLFNNFCLAKDEIICD